MNTIKQELESRIKQNLKIIDILVEENERNRIMLKEIEEFENSRKTIIKSNRR